jgi:hypothetical protein
LLSLDAFGAALIDRSVQRARSRSSARRDTFVAERAARGFDQLLPARDELHRRAAQSPVFYARATRTAMWVWARAPARTRSLSLEIGTSGPRASLVLPFARWLGLARFFPVDARVGSLDGISAARAATRLRPSSPTLPLARSR